MCVYMRVVIDKGTNFSTYMHAAERDSCVSEREQSHADLCDWRMSRRHVPNQIVISGECVATRLSRDCCLAVCMRRYVWPCENPQASAPFLCSS